MTSPEVWQSPDKRRFLPESRLACRRAPRQTVPPATPRFRCVAELFDSQRIQVAKMDGKMFNKDRAFRGYGVQVFTGQMTFFVNARIIIRIADNPAILRRIPGGFTQPVENARAKPALPLQR